MKNEAIAALEPLVGEWKLTMTNAWFLDPPDQKVEGSARISASSPPSSRIGS
jgi:hypothetical protein